MVFCTGGGVETNEELDPQPAELAKAAPKTSKPNRLSLRLLPGKIISSASAQPALGVRKSQSLEEDIVAATEA